jgi:hypothetical protein
MDTIDRINTLADDAAAKINNALSLGTTEAEHRKIRKIVALAIARAIAQQRELAE